MSEEKLKKVLADVFKMDVSNVNDNSSVDSVELWDSLHHLNLILALELEFGVSFTEEQTVEMLNYPLIKTILREHGVAIQ
jgi:acyl carrier protein